MNHLRPLVSLLCLAALAGCGVIADDETDSTASPLSIGRVPAPQPPINMCNIDPVGCIASGTRLLVVGPSLFATDMGRLVDHKNATAMPAAFVTMETVRNYAGIDDAEKLKNVIVAARSKGVAYVLIAGDGTVVPVRRRMVFDLTKNAFGYIPADLYYSNLFHHAGPLTGSFDSWDGDHDGLYDLEHWADRAYSDNPDGVDGYPDVAVGRVPAGTVAEFARFVEKDIRYEKTLNPTMNLGRAAFVADANYPTADSLIDSIIAGSFLSNTGSPQRWGANYPQPNTPLPADYAPATSVTIDGLMMTQAWVGYVGHGASWGWDVAGYDENRLATLANANNPIVFAAACETGQFAPILNAWPNAIYDASSYPSIARTMTVGSTAEGGAIAYFGETVVLPNYLGVELETKMFNAYGAGARVLGDVWLGGARAYWANHLTSEKVFENSRIYLAIMTLLGDPSLRLA